MKRLALLGVLLLAGCGPTTPSIDTAALKVVVSKVVGYTREICSFIPTDATVTAIIASMSLEAGTAHGIASAICEAVTKADTEGSGKGETCPMVAGVCVEGEFVPNAEVPGSGAEPTTPEGN